MSSNFFFYSGIASFIYTIYAGAKYYTLSGENLVSPEMAKQLIASENFGEVIDVRTKLEWDMGHYRGAIHIPTGKISEKTTKDLNKDKIYIVYCNTGQRARMASKKLQKLGFRNVYYIEGSYKSII